MADVKSLLKEARKLIDDCKYIEAQECCKNILRKDKSNYLGLVLLGKSLQDGEQAPLAYQKAISSKPDHPLAWQGLANYYERSENISSKIKLFSIYDEILKLQIEDEKVFEILTKLGQLGCSLKNNKAISIIVHYMDNAVNEKYIAAQKQLLELLKMDIICQEDDISNIQRHLTEILSKDQINNESLQILVGKVILQKTNFTEAFTEVTKLNFFNNSTNFREWLCQYLCKFYIKDDSFYELDIDQYINEITAGIENSKYVGLLKSMICYHKELYLEAYKLCVPLINYQKADITEATFVIKCTCKLKKWQVTQKLATNFLLIAKESNFILTLKRFLFISLAEQQKWKQAITVAKDIPVVYLDVNNQALLAKCYIETNENAEDVMKNLQTSSHYTQLQALALIKDKNYQNAITLLEQSLDDTINLFYIGKAHWELQNYDECYIFLLKAAKLNSEHAETFFYLGLFYQKIREDFLKAKKCFEKAYSLDSTNIDTIQNLSNVYAILKQKECNFDLLYKTSQKEQINQPWISLRLGLHYLNNREWENAIVQFRNVIKTNHSDATAFECLADAYFSRGSFTSALKAYNKVISMDPNKTLYCLTRIGCIHSLLTEYEEAIASFEKVLKEDPYSILALKGIAETWMKIAKKKFSTQLYGCARDNAQNAINYLVTAITKENKFLCFWNLLGDALRFVTKLPNQYCFVYMKNTLTDGSEEIVRKDKLDLYPQAIACYSRVAKQKQLISTYHLASTYFEYYLATMNMLNCQISFKLTVACVKSKPSSWRNWNLLGKICIFMKKYSIAQHSFIKALQFARKQSAARIWCNLGTLYLKLKRFKLANYSFSHGQSAFPSYAQSWIGQALIAEEVREEEAMDLFRHASRLGYHPESALGYSDWVCRTLKTYDQKDSSDLKYVIDSLHAVPYAMDLLQWFSVYEPNNACSSNILGILQERSGLLNAALKSYENAFKYAEDDKKNIILLNIGRIFLRLERYDYAIKIYQSITEASLNSACGLALALFKKGHYDQSYTAYDTALNWLCNTNEDKSDLLIAMAGIVYMYKGVDDSKTLLFQCLQVSHKNQSPHSLFAICSLGIVHSDPSLPKLALRELRKYEKDIRYGYDIGFLKSFVALEDVNEAIKLLSDSLHDHPGDAELWYTMAEYCLRESNKTAKIASCCAKRALCSVRNSENKNSLAKLFATASIADHLAGEKTKAFSLAKTGLHMYPYKSEVWAALLFCIVTNKLWLERKTWILSVAGRVRKNHDTTRALSRWINLLEKKLTK